MFVPMAELAKQVISANPPSKCQIRVVPKSSMELVVDPTAGDCHHLPAKVDIVVSEILDHGLIGEGLIPTMRHAFEHLLQPGAVVVPARAVVFAQLVSCAPLWDASPAGSPALHSTSPRL